MEAQFRHLHSKHVQPFLDTAPVFPSFRFVRHAAFSCASAEAEAYSGEGGLGHVQTSCQIRRAYFQRPAVQTQARLLVLLITPVFKKLHQAVGEAPTDTHMGVPGLDMNDGVRGPAGFEHT